MNLNFDWTNLKKPKISNGIYYWLFDANIVSPNISEEEREEATLKGLKELILFYGKAFPTDFDALIKLSLSRSKILLDPRPNCYFFKILVSISVDTLNSLPDKRYELENLLVVNTTTARLQENLNELIAAIARHNVYAGLWGKFLHVDDYLVELNVKRRILQAYTSMLAERALLNDVVYEVSDTDSLQLLFNADKKFIGAILNQKPLIRGNMPETVQFSLYDTFVSHLVSEINQIGPLVYKINRQHTREDWQGFYHQYITYGAVSFKEPERPKNNIKDAAQSVLDNTNLENYVNAAKQSINNEISRFKEIPEQFLGNACGPIDLEELSGDLDRISKTRAQKEAEDVLLSNATFRAELHQSNRNRIDYVGDALFDSLPTVFPNGPNSLDEVYENVLNRLSFDLLIKKSLQCLLSEGELPDLWKLCVDIYIPFSLTLPDNLKIPDIFGFISKIVVKALLFVLQEVLFLLIDKIMEALEKCIRGELIDTGAIEALSYFGDNFDAADAFLAKKVYDNLDNLGEFTDLGEDEFSDTGSLLQDVAAALTPQEFCMLLAGTAPLQVLKIILCIIETRYPQMSVKIDSTEKVKSIFAALGHLADSDKCSPDLVIPVPVDPDLCLTREQIDIREMLLKNKYENISPQRLASQLQEAEARRQSTITNLNNLLQSKSPFDDEVFGDQDKEEFLINLSPCARDNEPIKHMIELSTDSMVDSLSSFFNQAALSETGLAAFFKDSVKSEYLASLRANDFVQIDGDGFSIGRGQNKLRYRTSANGLVQTINISSITLTSTDVPPPEVTVQSGNARVNYFKSLSPLLNDTDYKNVFVLLTEFVTSTIGKSLIFSETEEALIDAIQSMVSDVTGTADLYENCWENGINVRDGINESYFEKDCETRDTSLYTQSAIAGLLRLYTRTLMIEFFLKNSGIITQFNSKDLINTFVKDFVLIRMSPIVSSIDKTTFIEDIDTLIDTELDIVYLEFKNLLEDYTNPSIRDDDNNVIHYFFDGLPVLEKDPKFVAADRFFLVPETIVDQIKNEVTIKLHLKYAKRIGMTPEIVSLASTFRKVKDPVALAAADTEEIIEEMREELKLSRKIQLVFKFAIPVNDLLSFVAAYNMTRIRNNVFEQLFIMNENIVKNLENSDNFVYRNRSFERQNKLQQADSIKNDKRKSRLKEILDE